MLSPSYQVLWSGPHPQWKSALHLDANYLQIPEIVGKAESCGPSGISSLLHIFPRKYQHFKKLPLPLVAEFSVVARTYLWSSAGSLHLRRISILFCIIYFRPDLRKYKKGVFCAYLLVSTAVSFQSLSIISISLSLSQEKCVETTVSTHGKCNIMTMDWLKSFCDHDSHLRFSSGFEVVSTVVIGFNSISMSEKRRIKSTDSTTFGGKFVRAS